MRFVLPTILLLSSFSFTALAASPIAAAAARDVSAVGAAPLEARSSVEKIVVRGWEEENKAAAAPGPGSKGTAPAKGCTAGKCGKTAWRNSATSI
jgi:hypothetical protein